MWRARRVGSSAIQCKALILSQTPAMPPDRGGQVTSEDGLEELARRQGRRRAWRAQLLHGGAEELAGAETWNPRRRDGHGTARARMTTAARLAPGYGECAEASERDGVPLLQ